MSVAPEPVAPPVEYDDARDPEWGFALPHDDDGAATEDDSTFGEVLDEPAPQFWRERDRGHPASQAHPAPQPVDDSSVDSTAPGAEELIEENRRLKLLLAERLLSRSRNCRSA